MKEGWTPGPWAIETDPYIHVRAKDGSQGGWGLTVLARDWLSEEDGNLIAAAPDLYEALDAIMSERWTPGGRSEAVSDKARAALAKARGEA